METRENVILAPFTTLGVGGPARYLAEAAVESDVATAFEFATRRDLPVFVLGGGSNIVVSDKGFAGVVIRVAIKGIAIDENGVATVGAGEDWDAFVGRCISEGLAGVECLSGIPGTVGGTPVQNVGAYGQEVSESIVSVRAFDRLAGRFVDLSNEECGFGYRSSIFNTTTRDRYIITSVKFRLEPGGSPKVAYKDLKEVFGKGEPSPADVRQAVMKIRRAKSMVIDAADPNSRSVGSFFKNPVVDSGIVDRIAKDIGALIPQFPAGEGKVKLPAAWLIENAGFAKGFRLGRAGISQNHSLAIVNFDGADAAEIVRLQELICGRVKERFGIELTPEPVFVGEMDQNVPFAA